MNSDDLGPVFRGAVLGLIILFTVFVSYTAPNYTDKPEAPARREQAFEQTKHVPLDEVQENAWFNVHATRIGLVGQTTASGHVIQPNSMFVALPCRTALHRRVEVQYKDRVVEVFVLDVGPWSTRDAYWYGSGVPLAEQGKRVPTTWMDRYGPPRNPAAIDLSDAVWDTLGIERRLGVVEVSWRFTD